MVEKNKTVLISMTGGMESTVAAYLLKKQGYKTIAISFQFFDSNDQAGPFSDVIVSDLTKVKAICNHLDIPFYAVNAVDMFKDHVIDRAVGRILSGHTFEPMVYLNYVIFELLVEKAKKLNASYIASAHYAKVLKNQKTGSYELMVANDLDKDQSYLLTRLEQKHLENLILPLSEIKKKEVEKISELIKVDFIKRPKEFRGHIMHDPRMIKFVEANAPEDLCRTGNIYDFYTETSICEHQGIHHFYVGQTNLPSRPEFPIDPLKAVISIVPFKGNIFIDYPDRVKFTHVVISRFLPVHLLDMTQPMLVYVKTSLISDKIPCKLYFKNNRTCVVDFGEEKRGVIVPGQYFVFYTRDGEKGKVIGSGTVESSGILRDGQLNYLPLNRQDEARMDKDEVENVKVNSFERYNF